MGEYKYPNIIVIGETGAGKSSIINLIANQNLAKTSNRAVGCTFEHTPYVVAVDNVECRLWDTTGLDEGTKGTVPAHQAEKNLKDLMRQLAHHGGINLVLYCFRSGRATKALKRDYDVFYSRVCRKKVPIVLVVTGLEHQEGDMERWWNANERILQRYDLRFDAHACVTGLERNHQARRLDSQRILRDLVLTYSRRPPWKIEQSFISRMFPLLHDLTRDSPPSNKPKRTVIVCDMATDAVIACPPGVTSSWQRCLGSMGNQEYEFIHVDKCLLNVYTPLTVTGGLLLFYTSSLVDTGIPREDADMLKRFYHCGGGLTLPMIVVLRGRYDEGVAQKYWDIASSLGIQAHFTSLPVLSDYGSGGEAELMTMIERLWLEPEPLKSSKSLRSSVYKVLLDPIIWAIRSRQKSSVAGFGLSK